jgi:hypothetical protein
LNTYDAPGTVLNLWTTWILSCETINRVNKTRVLKEKNMAGKGI